MSAKSDTPETHSHKLYMKLPMYLFFNLALGLNNFDGGHWKRLASKIETFLGLK